MRLWDEVASFLLGAVASMVATVFLQLSLRRRLLVIAGVMISLTGAFTADSAFRYLDESRLRRGPTALEIRLEAARKGYAYRQDLFARPGDEVTYVLIVKNRGPGRAAPLVVG